MRHFLCLCAVALAIMVPSVALADQPQYANGVFCNELEQFREFMEVYEVKNDSNPLETVNADGTVCRWAAVRYTVADIYERFTSKSGKRYNIVKLNVSALVKPDGSVIPIISEITWYGGLSDEALPGRMAGIEDFHRIGFDGWVESPIVVGEKRTYEGIICWSGSSAVLVFETIVKNGEEALLTIPAGCITGRARIVPNGQIASQEEPDNGRLWSLVGVSIGNRSAYVVTGLEVKPPGLGV